MHECAFVNRTHLSEKDVDPFGVRNYITHVALDVQIFFIRFLLFFKCASPLKWYNNEERYFVAEAPGNQD